MMTIWKSYAIFRLSELIRDELENYLVFLAVGHAHQIIV